MMKLRLKQLEQLINKRLVEIYPENTALNKNLAQAMNYSLLAGGKRLRPIMLMAATDAVGGDGEKFLDIAIALELIHTYSLIHDDLPAMDNDDYRRGKLTNHKVYGESLAILAGDALLTMAFQIIAQSQVVDADKKIRLIEEISTAVGPDGMVGGQVIDMQSENKPISLEELQLMHLAKTGRLFIAAIRSGAILGDATPYQLDNLTAYAENFGLAFQITDDILDFQGDPELIGKPVGSDAKNHKATYVTLTSKDKAAELAHDAVHKATIALASFGKQGIFLRELVAYLVSRNK